MIVADSSAVVAFLLEEPEVERIEDALARSPQVLLPTPAYVECCLVLTGKLGDEGVPMLDRFIGQKQLSLVPFTDGHARLAREAFLRYGKGRHAAALNFGDCMSYAVAKAEGLPLLYVGGDFARTDVAGA